MATAGQKLYTDSKPYTRWWWFSAPLEEKDITYQLDWIKENEFGGVEIAWIYSLEEGVHGEKFLGNEWSDTVLFAKQYAKSIELGCDFTFGSMWPFGGTFVPEDEASKVFVGTSEQRIERMWDPPSETEPNFILDHLSKKALKKYAEKVGKALAPSLKVSPSAIFCDSWEVETEKLWSENFDILFEKKFGYDVKQFMHELGDLPHVIYDYRRLISQLVLDEFYKPFTTIAHQLKAISRVQCHGAPTDLLSAYAEVDVPESEALLFDPDFSVIAASAATLSGKEVVSCEAFTCLYGWEPFPGPGPHQKKEQIADLKLLADALIANGVNQFIWHGMPYNAKKGKNMFYASTHVSPDSSFRKELKDFNVYLAEVCSLMKQGKSYVSIAVYLPLEDMMLLDELPEEDQKPSAKYHWELHDVKMPEELRGYRPTWISNNFLKEGKIREGRLLCGKASFDSLYIDSEWMDLDTLQSLLTLAKKGLKVYLSRKLSEPGRIKSADYQDYTEELLSLENVSSELEDILSDKPLVEGDEIPEFWCRVVDKDYYLFFAQPKSKEIKYPMTYGQAYSDKTVQKSITININRKSIKYKLTFKPYQSVLLKINARYKVEEIKMDFLPSEPRVAKE